MKKNVWIINHYAGNTFFEKGGRHYALAKYLRQAGYSPVVFCCNAQHNSEKQSYLQMDGTWEEQIAEEIGIPYVFVQGRTYTGNGKQRILNMVDFYRNVKKTAKEYAAAHEKPDIIYASSVHPLTLVAGQQLAKWFGIKCICEIRDLWPESILVYSDRIKKGSLFAKLLYCGEKWLYKKADALIFTMAGGADYIKEHRWDREHGGPIDLDKVFHINNGVDLEVFDQNAEEFRYEDSELDDAKIFKAVYAGSIRRVNQVGTLLDAAKLLDPKKVRLLIFGSGDESDELRERVIREKIENVSFKGRVDKKYIPSIVKRADLNIVHWQTSPLIRYGDSSNKSFEYFAAGRPVLFTTRPGYSVVERYQCGFTANDQKPESIAKAINECLYLSVDERAALCRNARSAAKEYDFKKLTEKLIEIIETIKNN